MVFFLHFVPTVMLTVGDGEIPNFSKLKDYGSVLTSSSSKIGNKKLYKVQNDFSKHIFGQRMVTLGIERTK